MIAAQQNQTRGRRPGSAPETHGRLVCVRCGRDGHVSATCPWPMRLSSALPLDVARCEPSKPCHRLGTCARANCAPDARRVPPIDASTTIAKLGCCAMFFDARGSALRGTQ